MSAATALAPRRRSATACAICAGMVRRSGSAVPAGSVSLVRRRRRQSVPTRAAIAGGFPEATSRLCRTWSGCRIRRRKRDRSRALRSPQHQWQDHPHPPGRHVPSSVGDADAQVREPRWAGYTTISKRIPAAPLDPVRDRETFMNVNVFNRIIARTDAHAKNYSMLLGAQGEARLAPLTTSLPLCRISTRERSRLTCPTLDWR